jgi:hypothetical protein
MAALAPMVGSVFHNSGLGPDGPRTVGQKLAETFPLMHETRWQGRYVRCAVLWVRLMQARLVGLDCWMVGVESDHLDVRAAHLRVHDSLACALRFDGLLHAYHHHDEESLRVSLARGDCHGRALVVRVYHARLD